MKSIAFTWTSYNSKAATIIRKYNLKWDDVRVLILKILGVSVNISRIKKNYHSITIVDKVSSLISLEYIPIYSWKLAHLNENNPVRLS